jgi:hypothetical protein
MTSTEDASVGFETESKYRLHLVGYSRVLGAQSHVNWNGKRYAIHGEASDLSTAPVGRLTSIT